MAERVLAPLLVCTAVGHALVGVALFSEPGAAMLREGLVNTIPLYGPPEREAAFWFLLFSPALLMVGAVTRHAVRRHDPHLLATIGWYLLVMSVAGALVMPVSGFWIVLAIALMVLRAAYRESPPSWERAAQAVNVFAMHTALYRLLGGRVVGRHVLILTTTGRRTGKRRSTPLFYVRDGDDFVVAASNGGDERHPAWWHNIGAHAEVGIEVGRTIFACRAEAVRDDDEIAALWQVLDTVYGSYARYRASTRRTIPLVRLRPIPGATTR